MAFLFKLALCGDGAVGKTAVRERFIGKGFSSGYLMTIGADYALKEVKPSFLKSAPTLKFQIWDFSGQPRFKSVRGVYLLGTLGMIILYDVTRYDSFENIWSWIEEGWINNRKGAIPFVIGANKIDLRDEFGDSITEEEGRSAVEKISKVTKKELGFSVPYIEVSAETGEGVTDLFKELGLLYIDWINKKSHSV